MGRYGSDWSDFFFSVQAVLKMAEGVWKVPDQRLEDVLSLAVKSCRLLNVYYGDEAQL